MRRLSIKYTLLGNPIPLARARFGQGRVYNLQTPFIDTCRYDLMMQHNKQPLLTGPLHLEIHFFMPLPNSWTLRRKENAIDKPHKSKPDLSNLLKLVEDCGNGVIYKDDCLIASVTGTKTYDWIARTEFTITEIK